MDIYVNPGLHDLDFSSNTFRYTVSSQELLRQRIAITLLTYKGEWFANINFGVPYLQTQSVARGILGKVSQALFDSEIKKAILGVEGVSAILRYSSQVSPQERTINIQFTVQTDSGDEVTFEEQI